MCKPPLTDAAPLSVALAGWGVPRIGPVACRAGALRLTLTRCKRMQVRGEQRASVCRCFGTPRVCCVRRATCGTTLWLAAWSCRCKLLLCFGPVSRGVQPGLRVGCAPRSLASRIPPLAEPLLCVVQPAEEKPIGEVLKAAAWKATGGGLAGAGAMFVNVGTLMWMRTTVNFQYR